MKNLTISLPDDLYRQARSKAAAADTSLTQVVRNFLTQWAIKTQTRAELTARLDALFAESDARDRDQPGSAGPFSRTDLDSERLERFR
jgi:plasmid stability protein